MKPESNRVKTNKDTPNKVYEKKKLEKVNRKIRQEESRHVKKGSVLVKVKGTYESIVNKK